MRKFKLETCKLPAAEWEQDGESSPPKVVGMAGVLKSSVKMTLLKCFVGR